MHNIPFTGDVINAGKNLEAPFTTHITASLTNYKNMKVKITELILYNVLQFKKQ